MCTLVVETCCDLLQVVQNLRDEDGFVVRAVKEEATSAYQLLLRGHTHSVSPLEQTTLPSLAGRTDRLASSVGNLEQ